MADLAAELTQARDLHRAGRLAEAESLYRAALAADPDNGDALHLLGVLIHQHGRHAEAAALVERALARDGARADYWRNLAVVRAANGDVDTAIAAARRAVALDDRDANSLGLLGALLASGGVLDEAKDVLTRAVASTPTHAAAKSDLAGVLARLGQHDEAEAMLREVVAAQPGFAGAWHNLAFLAWTGGDFVGGLESLARALTIDPGWREARLLRGVLLRSLGRLDEARDVFRAMIAERHDDAEAHFSLAQTLLFEGNFAEGWREFEWRWRRGEMKSVRRTFAVPQWDGSPLEGRTILLYAEQGLGDAIQFVRYAALVKSKGAGRVILECGQGLHALFRDAPGIDAFAAKGEVAATFDCCAPLLSLPLAFGTTLETIPAPGRYLGADPAGISVWAARLAHLPRPRVGLCWQGNPDYKGDRLRSFPLAVLAPFLRAVDGSFVSLQKGAGESQITPSGLADRIAVFPDMDAGDHAFADTAALMENLDLIVTSDTSIAHLAGALGRPVWTMLTFAPDWRWLQTREDSPWYPTMKLFRQAVPGDWATVVDRITKTFRQRYV